MLRHEFGAYQEQMMNSGPRTTLGIRQQLIPPGPILEKCTMLTTNGELKLVGHRGPATSIIMIKLPWACTTRFKVPWQVQLLRLTMVILFQTFHTQNHGEFGRVWPLNLFFWCRSDCPMLPLATTQTFDGFGPTTADPFKPYSWDWWLSSLMSILEK